jgi:hypothetical protein
MNILFAVIVIFAFAIAFILLGKNRSKPGTVANISNIQKFIFGDEHTAILSQIKKYDGKHLSADALQGLTNIEPVRVNAILTDLVEHDLLIQTNTDKVRGGWLYILSDNGRKYMLEHS